MMYSTHSHYLINPAWLDQAFIISNAAMSYNDVTERPPEGSRYTSVAVERYRNFVGSNPDKITYFQPVLDRLQVVPSRLDALQPSVLLEGKGDYLIISLGLLLGGKAGDYAVIPTRGADQFGDLVSIFLGWGVNFAICCDDDPKGRKAVSEFVDNWGIPSTKAFTLIEIESSLQGKMIEHLLEPEDLAQVSRHYNLEGIPSKSQIQLFFSEKLAVTEQVTFSSGFMSRIDAFDERVRKALNIPPAAQPSSQTKGQRRRNP